jgi:quinate dehydrogenase (quinone)
VVLAVAAGNMFVAHPSVAHRQRPGPDPGRAGKAQKDWATTATPKAAAASPRWTRSTAATSTNCKVAWTYHTGDVAVSDGNGAEDQLTPLQIGNKVFICTPHNNLIALDADTGKELWKNAINAKSKVWQRCRGLAYFDATAPIAQPTQPGSSPIIAASVPAGATASAAC